MSDQHSREKQQHPNRSLPPEAYDDPGSAEDVLEFAKYMTSALGRVDRNIVSGNRHLSSRKTDLRHLAEQAVRERKGIAPPVQQPKSPFVPTNTLVPSQQPPIQTQEEDDRQLSLPLSDKVINVEDVYRMFEKLEAKINGCIYRLDKIEQRLDERSKKTKSKASTRERKTTAKSTVKESKGVSISNTKTDSAEKKKGQ